MVRRTTLRCYSINSSSESRYEYTRWPSAIHDNDYRDRRVNVLPTLLQVIFNLEKNFLKNARTTARNYRVPNTQENTPPGTKFPGRFSPQQEGGGGEARLNENGGFQKRPVEIFPYENHHPTFSLFHPLSALCGEAT